MNAPLVLSPESLAKIDQATAKYPPDQKQSAVMAALTIAQDEKGWLAPETMDFVAQYLGMPPIAVYEVASFYTMYDLAPVGKCKLAICTNLPCALQGATVAAEHLKRKLGIEFGETSVRKYMVRCRKPPSQRWRVFLENHGSPLKISSGLML